MLPGIFPDKVTPWYWFYRWSSSSMWYSSGKNTFVGDVNLQMITTKFWYEYSIYGTNFVYDLVS